VWTPNHPQPNTLDRDNDISSYLTYRERQCRCHLAEHTALTPPYAEQSGVPCFKSTDVDSQPTARHKMLYFLGQPCYTDDHIHDSFLHYDTDGGESEQRRFITACLTPAREEQEDAAQRTVFVIGDSHAAVLMPGLMLALNGAASVVWISTGAGCGYLSHDFIATARTGDLFFHGALVRPCQLHNQIVNEVLERYVQACDIVIVHQHSTARDQYGGKLQGGGAAGVASQRQYYRDLQTFVQSRDARLVLIGDVGELNKEGTRCAISQWAREDCEMPLHEVEDQVALERSIYSELALANGTYYLPLHSYLCDRDDRCGAFIPGTDTLLYADRDHMTTEGSLYLWPFLCAFFQDNGLLD